MFDLDHGVGALGQGSAGHDAGGVARPEWLAGRLSGGDLGGDDEAFAVRGAGEVDAAHGEAVHGGVVERRHRRGRDDLGGRDAAQGFEQWQPLLTHRPHLGEHQVDGFIQADHRCASLSFGVPGLTDLTDRPRGRSTTATRRRRRTAQSSARAHVTPTTSSVTSRGSAER